MSTSVSPLVLEHIEEVVDADDAFFKTGEHTAIARGAPDLPYRWYGERSYVVTSVTSEAPLTLDEQSVSALFDRLNEILRRAVVHTQYWAGLAATNAALRETRAELQKQKERIDLVERCIRAFFEFPTPTATLISAPEPVGPEWLAEEELAEAVEITTRILREEFGDDSHVDVSVRHSSGEETMTILEAHYGQTAVRTQAEALGRKHERVLERYVEMVPRRTRKQLVLLRVVP